MVQACTLFLSRMGRFGLGLLTLALPNLRTLFLRIGSRFLPRSLSLEGLGPLALTLYWKYEDPIWTYLMERRLKEPLLFSMPA